MIFECFFSVFGCNVFCIGFFANELFFNLNIIFRFKSFGMRGEVAISYSKKFFKHIEIGTFVYHQYRHNPQTNSVIKGFVNILYDGFQIICMFFLNLYSNFCKSAISKLISIIFKIHHASVNYMANSKS